MADYYEESRRRSPEKRRSGSLAGYLLDGVMAVVSVVMAVATVLTLIAPHIHPGSTGLFPVLGLVAPVIFGSTILLALYWIIRWRKYWALVMTLLAVVSLTRMSFFLRPQLQRSYGEATYPRNSFTVLTYNVRGFYDDCGKSSVDSVVQLVRRLSPDVICFQEFGSRLRQIDALLPEYGSVAWKNGDREGTGSQLAVYSRLRIVGSDDVLIYNDTMRDGRSIWVDLLVGRDTVRLFNNHLRSTAITSDDDRYITRHEFLSDTASEKKIRSIVHRFRDNSILRANQAEIIAETIAAVPYPCIVCGDFNDTPMSYVYRTIVEGLDDSFRRAGKGFSYTYRGFLNTLRIDYVLCSKQFDVLSYEVLDRVDYSDHHPVLVRLQLTN